MAGWDGLNRREVLRGFGAGAAALHFGLRTADCGLEPRRESAIRNPQSEIGGLFKKIAQPASVNTRNNAVVIVQQCLLMILTCLLYSVSQFMLRYA